MGRIKTPKYRIEMSCIHFVNKRREVHTFAFSGKPSESSAKTFRDGINKSMLPGEVNYHLSAIHSPYNTATIVNQHTGEVLAQYKPASFEIV